MNDLVAAVIIVVALASFILWRTEKQVVRHTVVRPAKLLWDHDDPEPGFELRQYDPPGMFRYHGVAVRPPLSAGLFDWVRIEGTPVEVCWPDKTGPVYARRA